LTGLLRTKVIKNPTESITGLQVNEINGFRLMDKCTGDKSY